MDEMIRLEGADELAASLEALDADIQTRVMRAALRDAGELMRAAVQERAPVKTVAGGKLPEGALKSDVKMSITTIDGKLAAMVYFGSLTYYVARWVEYGHRLVKGGYSSMKRGKLRGNGKQIGDVPAYPFIRPAFEATVRASVDAFVDRLKSEIKKRAGAPARKAA